MNHSLSLIYVTGNDLKFAVAAEVLQDTGIRLEQSRLSTPEIQSAEVEEIAEWSAQWASRELQKPVVVTDAGFYIEALRGFPGPFVKFVNEWLTAGDYLKLMQNHTNRQIVIRECLAYSHPGQKPVTFSQFYQGTLALTPGAPRGTAINQLFIPEGYSQPISELSPTAAMAYWSQLSAWLDLKAYLTGNHLLQG